MTKTVTITENLPSDIDLNKLRSEIQELFPTAIVYHRTHNIWSNNTELSEAVIVENLNDAAVDQDIIDVINRHRAYGLLGKIHECAAGCFKCNGEHLYRTMRRRLIAYVQANYQTMTPAELKEASEHFCTPAEIRDLFFTMEEQIQLGDIFNQRAMIDRKIRRDKAVSILMNHLTYSETIEVVNDLSEAGDLVEKYVTFGVEGTTEGDSVGLFDYFESTPGTIFENTGFLQKGFVPRHCTLQKLSEDMMTILRIVI